MNTLTNTEVQRLPFGASPEEWDHFANTLLLAKYLLPIVANPEAPIAKGSSIKSLGKLPSRYNGAREVVGFAGWPTSEASAEDIARWRSEPDYSIGIRCGAVVALDVDINDLSQSSLPLGFISQRHPHLLDACRRRANSGRFLLMFSITDGMVRGKRRFVCENDAAVEFLAEGQQFVAAGTHPSGVRYEWGAALPSRLPCLTGVEFEDLWDGLVATFALPGTEHRAGVAAELGAPVEMDDPRAKFLHDHGHVIKETRRGFLRLQCPWHEEHTTDGEEAIYMPAGTRGVEVGNYKCQHAHCAHRTKRDFDAAFGFDEGAARALAEFGHLPIDDDCRVASAPSTPSTPSTPSHTAKPSVTLLAASSIKPQPIAWL